MAGLLYKDFIGIKGKKIIWILAGCTVLFLIVRLAFPGNVETMAKGVMWEGETGELVGVSVGEMRDLLMVTLPFLLMVVGFTLPSGWTAAICRNDEKNKTRQFTSVLPLDKNAYIASKYIFIGVSVYILFSLENMWIAIFNSVAGDNKSKLLMTQCTQLLPAFCGISLLLAAIELPFFITLGVKKGTVVKTAILEVLAFLVIAYLFFGNLAFFENFNFDAFLNWCEAHLVALMVFSMVSPVLDIAIFLLSYRITCKINENREVFIDG